MTDIRIFEVINLAGINMDFLLTKTPIGVGLDETRELATAVTVALGTDALVGADDILPDPDSDNREGWWADIDADEIWGGWPIGCKLWLMRRAKITPSEAREGSTLQRAIDYTQEALDKLIALRICSRVEVEGRREGKERIYIGVRIFRGPLPNIELRYQSLWDEIHPAPYEEFVSP